MTELTKDNFKREAEEAQELVFIDIFAEWCGPCRMLTPIVVELEVEHKNVKFARLNVDAEPELARQFHVESIPMIALLKGGVFLDFRVGYMPKAELSAFIAEYSEEERRGNEDKIESR